jgi:uncharacterized repeat protein (TIGR04138 family)
MTSDPATLARIRREIIESGRDRRYTADAYEFVLSGLAFYFAKLGEKRHVTGQELSKGLAECAMVRFGPFAKRLLCHWGISSTNDFGFIVYNLIDIELMSRQESDKVKDFFGVFDLGEYLDHQDYYSVNKERVRQIRGA